MLQQVNIRSHAKCLTSLKQSGSCRCYKVAQFCNGFEKPNFISSSHEDAFFFHL